MQYYERLLELRQKKKLSGEAVSQFLDISVRTYYNYESNRCRIPLSTLIRLARYYDCSMDYITGSSNRPGAFPRM